MLFSGEQVIYVRIAKVQTSDHTWSMNRWNVWAAFQRSNGIRRNLNKPNVVVMAVFGTSAGSTGIW